MNRLLLGFVIATLVAGAASAAEDVLSDVCVYGSTVGGITAAVQAARMGKSVVLLSANGEIGGMTTGGLAAADAGDTTTIGGIANEFLRRVGARNGNPGPVYHFQPHVADEELRAMLATAGVRVRYNQRIAAVTKDGERIVQIAMEDGTQYRAKMFIDASYEGDLMALAGVTWVVGREGVATYGESLAGVGLAQTNFQFKARVDPYLTPGVPESGLLPQVQRGDGGVAGSGDSRVQAYNYRLCLTSRVSNQIPITAPDGYAESEYELLARYIEARLAAGIATALTNLLYFQFLPNDKADVNNNGAISTDLVGGSYDYPTASHAEREVIAARHRRYVQGLLYFLGHASRVPDSIRTEMLSWGLCKDEFTANGGWPHQLYVREARRMVSDYVMLQENCTGTRVAGDSVGLGSYGMDSHFLQRVVRNGALYNEGSFPGTVSGPYSISYRSIIPRSGECENLLVAWAISASHVAYGSLRMEPVSMILGQSAGTAAAFAIDSRASVQQVDYAKLRAQLLADGQELGPPVSGIADTILDDGDLVGVTITGAWTKSSAAPGYFGAGYRHDGNIPSVGKTITFIPNLPVDGNYEVYLRWTADPNRASNVPVELTYGTQTVNTTVNQRNNGNSWYLISGDTPVALSAGAGASVTVRTVSRDGVATNGYVVADAVRFSYIAPLTHTAQIIATDAVAREDAPADTARFTVVRDATQASTDWTVGYSVSGSATPGTDFAALSGSVVIPAGQTSAPIYVTAIPDDAVEGDETVTLTLQPGADSVPGTMNSATATLIDKPTVQIAATDDTASEADPLDTAVFTVTRDPEASAAEWTVSYQIGGTATPGLDYAALTGTVTLPAGASSGTITVAPIRDALAEGPETVVVTLLPGALFSVGANAAATASIVDLPIEMWRLEQFSADQLADPAISGDTADPDGDGICNLAEYALGLLPFTPEASASTYGQDESGRLTMTYLQRRTATDTAVLAEGSTDLATWAADVSMVEETARVAEGAFDRVTVRLVPLNPDEGFLRVTVTRH